MNEKNAKQKSSRTKTRMLCEGAIMLALAIILNMLKIMRLPQAGSVDLSMVPVFMFAIRWGWKPGILLGFCFGLLQLFIDGAIAWGWQSLLLDYIVAYMPLGLCGIFKGKNNGIYPGILLGCFLRFIVHFISGVTIYKILVPTELFSATYTSPALYSLVYNGSYILIDTVICILIFALLMKSPAKKYVLAEDIA